MDARSHLLDRLARELDDESLAARVVATLDDDVVAALERLAGGDVVRSPALAYRPSTVAAGEVDSLWVFAFGYRFAPGADPPGPGVSGVDVGSTVPAADLVPGPTNEQLARAAAGFVARRSVPIVAQWEVARVLDDLSVPEVISVEPDVADDGSVIYLSTAGVAAKGRRLAAAAGVEVGRAGVLGHADHVVRCVLTAQRAGLVADVPDGVALPAAFDAESGQVWTRDRETWIPVDLMARAFLRG